MPAIPVDSGLALPPYTPAAAGELGRDAAGNPLFFNGQVRTAASKDDLIEPLPIAAPGPLAAVNGGLLIPVPYAFTIASISAVLGAAATGSALTFDIKYAANPGGPFASIFSTLPSFAAGSQVLTTQPVVSVAAFNSAMTYLRLDITAVGSTLVGSNLTVLLRLARTS